MKTFLSTLLVVGLVIAQACSSQKSENVVSDDLGSSDTVVPLINAYIELKDALVDSDAALAQNAARKIQGLKSIGDESDLNQAVEAIIETSDIELQREHFEVISEALIAQYKINSPGQTLYVQYCPMAFDDEGGSWISLSEEILNPYFGDQMLHCGSIHEKIE